MIFDVMKATRGFSKWGEREGSHNLLFEVVPKDGGRLDIGDSHILIGKGYHAFKGSDRQPVVSTVSVSSDATSLDRISGERPICGAAFFYKERDDHLAPQPATLAINVVVEPQILEGMARTVINEAGAATLSVGIEGLDFGPAPDGSHQIWNLEDASDCGHATRRRVTDFWYSVETFWTSEGEITEAEERQTNAWLADSPDPEDRKLAILSQVEKPDAVANLLRHCRALLVALLILGGVAFFRFA